MTLVNSNRRNHKLKSALQVAIITVSDRQHCPHKSAQVDENKGTDGTAIIPLPSSEGYSNNHYNLTAEKKKVKVISSYISGGPRRGNKVLRFGNIR